MALRENFEKFYNYVKTDEPENLKELLWKFYVQGSHDPDGSSEISDEEVKKIVEDQCFIDFVKSCIENPTIESEMHNGDYVEVVYPTCRDDPDHSQCAKCGNDPDDCESVQRIMQARGKKIINLSKLCNTGKGELEQALLTEEEIKEIAEALSN